MITIEDFLQTVNYRITGGSDYGWRCFGANARFLDSEAGRDQAGASMIFDEVTQTVYQVTAHDYRQQRAYRWTHPDWVDQHQQEMTNRGIPDQAWDTVAYTDLESAQDMLTKTQAIVTGRVYDTRIEVPLDMTDDERLRLMTMAHEQDITLNQLVEQILTQAIQAQKEQTES